MSKFSSEYGVRVVSALTFEASRLIREVAPPAEGLNVKSRVALAAQKLRWKLSRANDVWQASGKIRIRAEEIEQLRSFKAKAQTKAAKNELQELRATVARLADRINRIDADFYGPQADALGNEIRRLD